MNHNFWRGEKVRLRAIEQKDLDAVASIRNEPDSWLERADDVINFPAWYEKERDTLAAERERKGDSFYWLIENQDGEIVGNFATFDCDKRVGTFKYSIIIKRQYWGQGYASDAIKIVLRYYFRELRYQKCTVLIYSFNQRSLNLHEKIGFQLEGRLRNMVYTNGNFYDEIYFGMTTKEFDSIDPKLNLDDAPKYKAS